MQTVLCFGDSNTYGVDPRTQERFAETVRWPGVLRAGLGSDYTVIEEGQPGRTTIHDDPFEDDRNGLRYLGPCLDSHSPDLVILALGTNDLKHRFGLSPWEVAAGAARLAQVAGKRGPRPARILLLCPPPLLETGFLAPLFLGAAAKSRELPVAFRSQARVLGCAYLEAGQWVRPSEADGVHWEAEDHRALGRALVPAVRAALRDETEGPGLPSAALVT